MGRSQRGQRCDQLRWAAGWLVRNSCIGIRSSIIGIMYYYEVLVGDLQYHGKSALTYSSETSLLPRSVVRIALRSRSVLGIVLREVADAGWVLG